MITLSARWKGRRDFVGFRPSGIIWSVIVRYEFSSRYGVVSFGSFMVVVGDIRGLMVFRRSR
jgi:hypothetical protein